MDGRPGDHPRAGLGVGQGCGGAQRLSARHQRAQPGFGNARHPHLAAPPGTAGDAARRHPACQRRRPGAHPAAHGLELRRDPSHARHPQPRLAALETPGRAHGRRKNPRSALWWKPRRRRLDAHHFAAHADFFAIGTNDLTMYTLAADRGLALGTNLYDPLEPAVLNLIRTAALAADAGWHPHLGLRRARQPRPGNAAAARPWHPPALDARQRRPRRQTRHPRGHAGAMRGHGHRCFGGHGRRRRAQDHFARLKKEPLF